MWSFVLTVYMYFLLCRDLYSRDVLDKFLSRALNIELENNRLTLIDESNYVLTLDYTIKMLNIHERYGLCAFQIVCTLPMCFVPSKVRVWSASDY